MLVSGEKTKLSSLESKVNLLDPYKILNKGYTYTSSNGKSIAKMKLKKGDQLETYSEEKIIISKVEKIERYGKD